MIGWRQGGAPALIVTGALALLLGGCGGGSGDEELASQLAAELESASESLRQEIDFSSAVDFDWDRLVFVCPYEDAAQVERHLGFEWDDFPGEDGTEGRALYVFVLADEVTRWTRIDRSDGDPCHLDRQLPVTDPVVRIERTPDGLVLA